MTPLKPAPGCDTVRPQRILNDRTNDPEPRTSGEMGRALVCSRTILLEPSEASIFPGKVTSRRAGCTAPVGQEMLQGQVVWVRVDHHERVLQRLLVVPRIREIGAHSGRGILNGR